jgi:hypothetical protein
MKSLHTNNKIVSFNPDIFTPEIIEWIEKEGFEMRKNDSYCNEYPQQCYHTFVKSNSDYSIGVYIFDDCIGYDIDYDCGGNFDYGLYPFRTYTFEDAYDRVVDAIQRYKK